MQVGRVIKFRLPHKRYPYKHWETVMTTSGKKVADKWWWARAIGWLTKFLPGEKRLALGSEILLALDTLA
jgi:hypothetical protein